MHDISLSRRAFMRAAFAASGALLLPQSFAQVALYRPLRIIVPYAAGGQPDAVARLLGAQLGMFLNQPVVVENVTGAGGIPAFSAFQRTPPDGHTLLMADASHWAINPLLYKKLPYDAIRDLAPVRQTHATSLMLVTNSDLPATTLQDVVALARIRPGQLNYASNGLGTVQHLIMEVFKADLGLNIVHIPYRGSAQALPALLSGDVSMMLTSLASAAPFIKSGRVRVVAATTRQRSAFAPEVPTVAEAAGLTGFDYPSGNCFMARSGTAPVVIEKLASALDRVINTPDMASRFQAASIERVPNSSPLAVEALIRSDIEKYARAIKIAGVTPE